MAPPVVTNENPKPASEADNSNQIPSLPPLNAPSKPENTEKNEKPVPRGVEEPYLPVAVAKSKLAE